MLDFVRWREPHICVPQCSNDTRQRCVGATFYKLQESVVQLSHSRFIDFSKYEGQIVIATGTYDSCAQKITVKETAAIERY